MKTIYLYFAVSIVGGMILALEILSTRVLGPFYGVSIFLWSALLSITLAALSAGYVIGGNWADNGATISRMSTQAAAAGSWVMLIPLIKHPFLELAEPLGLRGAILIAAFVLFFPPLLFLGTISPM